MPLMTDLQIVGTDGLKNILGKIKGLEFCFKRVV